MSKIKLYYDTLSQPSRALKLFLLVNKIPYEGIAVNLAKGEQLQPEYEKINPLRKVPVLEHNGTIIRESVGILRYLCRELDIPDHWYPKDSLQQAKVDEYLEWQHLNTRLFCAMFVHYKVLKPKFAGEPQDEKMISYTFKGMQNALDVICNVWLKDQKYLCGDKISVADLLGVCELEQPRLGGYDVSKDRPILKAYMDRVRGDLQPHYTDVMKRFDKFLSKYGDLIAKL
uniref:Glutathione S-transferase theta class 1 n=1 Tax=Cuerna arida TaxID=1464854 RepID=A0A1B6F1V4_9HEMI